MGASSARRQGLRPLASYPAAARASLGAVLLATASAWGTTGHAQPARNAIAVEVHGTSEPVLCAEKDNVTVNLASPEVRRFTIEAVHPAYLAAIQRDSFEADWTGCTAPGDPRPEPSAAEAPRRITLYEEYDLWVVGQVYPSFWRPATATMRIGDRVEKGLHLVQVWLRRPMGGEEVLVLYPQDGYWRLRPRAPASLAPTAFGSSFLLGPVEVDGRPIDSSSAVGARCRIRR